MAAPSLADIPKARVVVVGDPILDQWIYGRVDRISPEAPVPILHVERVEEAVGGAANVVANLDALGCFAYLASPCDYEVPIIIKQRFVSSQQLLRVDHELTLYAMTPAIEDKIMERVAGSPFDVLVLSDYAKGTLTSSLCQRLIEWAKENGVKTIVDPKGDDWSKYDGADVITPNEKEWLGKDNMAIIPAALITKGAQGMQLRRYNQPVIDIPAINIEPKDVTGCGDTVVATLAACLAVGYDILGAARIANTAAGIACGKRGTATVSLEELEAALCI